jgi:hypothetical protein
MLAQRPARVWIKAMARVFRIRGALRGRPRYDGNADTLLASLGLIQKTASTILAAIARAETNAAEDTRPMMN